MIWFFDFTMSSAWTVQGRKDESFRWWKCVRGEKDKVPRLCTPFSLTCNVKLGYFTPTVPDTRTKILLSHSATLLSASQRQQLRSVLQQTLSATHGPRSLPAPWITLDEQSWADRLLWSSHTAQRLQCWEERDSSTTASDDATTAGPMMISRMRHEITC